jgi:hypothetical protein
MSDGAPSESKRARAAEDDSDCVVADTYDEGGDQEVSMASRFEPKRLKGEDDKGEDAAPTSAWALSAEQSRVEELVMSGKNVRLPAWRVARMRAQRSHACARRKQALTFAPSPHAAAPPPPADARSSSPALLVRGRRLPSRARVCALTVHATAR